MNRLSLFIIILSLLGLASCKSHRATVVRPSAPSSSIPAGVTSAQIASDPAYSNDPRVSDALIRQARSWIGTPYRYGGESKNGTDCSGMLMVIFKDVAHLSLPRNSAAQREYCLEVAKKKLEPGDLVFFSTSKRGGKVNHVGLYTGGGKMIHASSSKGVIESSIDEKYYVTHYHSSGRVYGITYAATGGKRSKSADAQEILLASSGLGNEAAVMKSSSRKTSKKAGQAKSGASGTPTNNSAVKEMTLDEFVAMQQSVQSCDTTVASELADAGAIKQTIADSVVADTVEAIREVPDQPTAGIKGPTVVVDGKRVEARPVAWEQPQANDTLPVVKEPVIVADTSQVVREVPVQPATGIKGPTVIIDGKRVEARPVRQDQPVKSDSVAADTVRQAEEIRDTVVKAMKFGK